MAFTKSLEKINIKDVSIAGGKGASLGEMIQSGIQVPPGFVILAETFENFLKETDINVEIGAEFKKVDTTKIHTAEEASGKIQALILNAEISKDISDEILKSFKELNANFVAVRSSATAEDSASAAWAGQLDSYLNIDEKNLIESVKKCWASLFTPRAIFYRFNQNLQKDEIHVAVVIQKMIKSDRSGVAFSVHPITKDKNQMIIEAAFGLGEGIVSGEVSPDSYVIEKDSLQIIDKNIIAQEKALYVTSGTGTKWKKLSKSISEKQVLTDIEILELSEVLEKIEKHYKFGVDVEWAFENGQLYITQSRPITTL